MRRGRGRFKRPKTHDNHPLLLDPLLSQDDDRIDHITLNLKSGFLRTGDNTASYGEGAEYSIPQKKLKATDAVFIQLKFGPGGGHSTTHAHAGDELMLVLEGQVEVRFEHSGIRTTIKAGGYIHFYAEQPHSAWCLGDKARLFIIRFNQLDQKGTRQAMRQEVEETLNEKREKRAGLSFLTRRWLLQAITRPALTEKDILQDKIGLARLLESLRRAEGRTPDVLARRSGVDKAKVKDIEDKIEHLEEASLPLECDDLVWLAKAYGVERMLFENFFSPGVPGVVVVREKERHGVDEDDINPIESSNLPSGVVYGVPCRNLAFSDITIAKVTLGPNCSTPWNWHSGCELLIPVRGAARVEYKDDGAPICTISDADEVFAHFRSVWDHRVTGVGPGHSEFLVVRFYSDGQLERAKGRRPSAAEA